MGERIYDIEIYIRRQNMMSGTLVNLRGSVSFKCSKFLFMQGHSVKMVYCQYLGIGVEGKEFSFTQS